MNLKHKTALSLIFISLLTGCGTGNSPIAADQENVNRAKVMRELYTKANGNWDSLSADDKAKFQKSLAPGYPVEKAWQGMAPQRVPMGGAGGDPRQGG